MNGRRTRRGDVVSLSPKRVLGFTIGQLALTIFVLVLLFSFVRSCLKPTREEEAATALAEIRGSASLVGAEWGISFPEQLQLDWLPSEFAGGQVELIQFPPHGVIKVSIQTPLLSDDSDATSAKQIYEKIKVILSQRFGKPHVSEYNLYDRHTKLYKCLSDAASIVSSATPRCEWVAIWIASETGNVGVHLEITEKHRVEITQLPVNIYPLKTKTRTYPIVSAP